jgi:hypothetical protein
VFDVDKGQPIGTLFAGQALLQGCWEDEKLTKGRELAHGWQLNRKAWVRVGVIRGREGWTKWERVSRSAFILLRELFREPDF